MKKPLFLLLSVLLPLSLLGTEYHVDQKVAEGGDGSSSAPFLTIKQAADMMVAGDICYIHTGIYRETLMPTNSGKASAPIRYEAFEDDIVIINATETINNWSVHSGNIYKASNIDMSLDKLNNVYYEAEKMQIARWPNDTDNDEYSLDAKYIDQTTGTYSMSFISNNEIPDIDWTGGIIHYLGAHSGCSWERSITDYDRSLHRIHFETLPDKWPFGTHSPPKQENGHHGIFYLMNKLEALDAPREWYYDEQRKELYLYAPDGKSPEPALVEIAKRERTAEIKANYIEINKLNFFGGMITIKGSHNMITNCMIKHGCEKLVTNNTGASENASAIQMLGGDFNTIEKCVLENGTLNGILIESSAEDCRVENCIIQRFNTIGIHAFLIRAHGKRAKIVRNFMYGSARDGAKVTGDDSEFGYNHVSRCLISGADGGLFYVTGKSIPRHIEVHHNWFHNAHADVHAGKKATGIYLDNNASGYIVHHNVVWDVEWGGLHFNWTAIENEVYNNTFWDIGNDEQATFDSWVPLIDGERSNVRDNIIYNNFSDKRDWWHSGDNTYRVDAKEYMGAEADNDFKNNGHTDIPQFVSIKDKNFMPFDGAIIIDKGRVIKGITDDYMGEAPDMGAYEYGAERWLPGVDWTPSDFAWIPGLDYAKINNLETPGFIRLYPNPVKHKLQVDAGKDLDYKVFSASGTELNSGKITADNSTISMQTLSKGIYYIQLNDNKQSIGYKIIKE